jgi:serine protease AprX
MIHHSMKTIALSVALSIAASGASKMSKDLENLDPDRNADVIVQFTQTPTDKHHQKVTDKGGTLKTKLDLVKGGLYSMPAGKLKDLAADPDVVYISPDRAVKHSLDYATSTVNANIAYTYGWDGSGIGVAVIDSGITNPTDLKSGESSRIVYSQNFVAGTSSTSDGNGHGTHVAGIVAGNGAASTGSSYFAKSKNHQLAGAG